MFVLVGAICWLVAEVYAFVAVADATSVLFALALLVATSALGVLALRRQGARTLMRMRRTLATGRAPTAELADGTGLVVGAALLILPGFVSDALGLLLVIPGIRRVVGRIGVALLRRRRGVVGRVARRRTAERAGVEGTVVEGEIVDSEVVENGGVGDRSAANGPVTRPADRGDGTGPPRPGPR